MGTTTIGIKVDGLMRDRLKAAAQQLGCTPHWLHKQALHSYLDAIEQGKPLPELQHLLGTTSAVYSPDAVEPDGLIQPNPTYIPFYALAQDVQPQSVLRAAITAAYRRPEPECLPLLMAHASTQHPHEVQKLATRLVQALRDKRQKKTSGVEALVQEYSLSSQEGVALMCLAEALLRIPDRATRDALIRDKVSQGDWKSHSDSPSLFVNAATWGLMITGKLVSVHSEQKLGSALTRLIARGGGTPDSPRCQHRHAHDGRAVCDGPNHWCSAGQQPPPRRARLSLLLRHAGRSGHHRGRCPALLAVVRASDPRHRPSLARAGHL